MLRAAAGVGVRELWRRRVTAGEAARGAAAPRWPAASARSPLREAIARDPRSPAAGSPRRSSRCAGPGARVTCRPSSSDGGWRCSGPRRSSSRRSSCSARGRRRSLAAAGPAAATWAVARRRAAYRRAVERGLAEVAIAVADALSVGRSARAALAAAAASLEGPPAREMERVRAELALGAPTRDALEALRRRVDSPRVDSFAAALLSQQLAGGDLATLLRRFAAAAADRDRTEADARSATAQARFTGPAGGRDAGRRGAARRAARAGIRRRAAGESGRRRRCSVSPPRSSSPASPRSGA